MAQNASPSQNHHIASLLHTLWSRKQQTHSNRMGLRVTLVSIWRVTSIRTKQQQQGNLSYLIGPKTTDRGYREEKALAEASGVNSWDNQ